MSSSLFSLLPGLDLPVAQIGAMLANYGQTPDSSIQDAKQVVRASQLNLVIHLGEETKVEELKTLFNTAVSFAQSYPCRIVLLCPTDVLRGKDSIDAKLFSLCYIGEDFRPLCSCEAVILGYLPKDSCYLEDLISLWIENDLPVYHWLHRASIDLIKQNFLTLLFAAKRILYDSSLEDPALQDIQWPHSYLLGDLVRAHLLPARQSLGQFLSSFAPSQLIATLSEVRVAYATGHLAEAKSLLDWQKKALFACEMSSTDTSNISFLCEAHSKDVSLCLEITWNYLDSKFLKWSYCAQKNSVHILADLGMGRVDLTQQLQLLNPEESLAEALFFAH